MLLCDAARDVSCLVVGYPFLCLLVPQLLFSNELARALTIACCHPARRFVADTMPENIRLGGDGHTVDWMDDRLQHGKVRRLWRTLRPSPSRATHF